MRRSLAVWLAFLLLAAACGGGTDAEPESTSGSSSSAPVATTVPDEVTSTTEPGDVPNQALAEYDPDLVEQLVALEPEPGQDWALDDAVEAFTLVKPLLVSGVEEYPPFELRHLMWYLATNAAELTDEQRSNILSASAPNPSTPMGVLASFQVDEAERVAYQQLAEQADNEFERLTGHALGARIVVALSEYGLLGGRFSAVTSAQPGDIDVNLFFGAFFATQASFDRLEELFEDAVDAGETPCVIILGEVFRARTPRQQTAALMHEITHCHQQVIFPGGLPAFYGSSTPWMDEGFASWAGEAFVGGTAISRSFWNDYHSGNTAGGFDTQRASYDAISLFSYLEDSGVDVWGNFVTYFREVRALGDGSAKINAVLSGISNEEVARWAPGSLRSSDLSPIWDYTGGPGISASTTARTPRPTPLVVDRDRSFALRPGEQGTFAVEPRLQGAGALLLEVDLRGPGAIRWPWGEDAVSPGAISAVWCLGEECVCEDGTVLGTPAPEFTEAPHILIASTGGDFVASLSEPEDECEEEETGPTADGACPAGVWQADPEAVVDLLVTSYRELGIADPQYGGGTVTMSFFDDESFRFDYVDTTFNETIDGIPATFVLNGGSFGNWEADASTLAVVIEGQDIRLDLSLSDQPALTVDAPSGTGGGSTEYLCGTNDELLIDPSFSQPLWPYPREWSRVGP